MLKIISTIFVLLLGGLAITHTTTSTNNLPTQRIETANTHTPLKETSTQIPSPSGWREALWGTPKKEQTYPDITTTPEPVTPSKSYTEQTPTIQNGATSIETKRYTPPTSLVQKNTPPIETPEAKELHTYGNTLGTMLKNFYSDTTRDKQALQPLSTTTLPINFTLIRELGNTYKDISGIVQRIPAPESVRTLNEQLATAYASLATAITDLATNEPARPTSRELKMYNNGLVQSFTTLANLARFLKEQHIVFTRGEGGDMFYSK
ncbi:MAG: hypothetical protein RLZZ347_648 [Candidatus Parcubacteria bacterium]|jgi:hypothetical protein